VKRMECIYILVSSFDVILFSCHYIISKKGKAAFELLDIKKKSSDLPFIPVRELWFHVRQCISTQTMMENVHLFFLF